MGAFRSSNFDASFAGSNVDGDVDGDEMEMVGQKEG